MTRLREAQETYKTSVERSSSLGTVNALKQLDSFSRSLEVEGGVVSPPVCLPGRVSNDSPVGGVSNGLPPQQPSHYPVTPPFCQQVNPVSPNPVQPLTHQHQHRTSIMTTSHVDDEEDSTISLDKQSSHWMAAHMYAVGVPPPVTRQTSQSSMRSGSLSSDLGELASPGRLLTSEDAVQHRSYTCSSITGDNPIAAVHTRDKSPCQNVSSPSPIISDSSSLAPPLPTTLAPTSPCTQPTTAANTTASVTNRPLIYKHALRQDSKCLNSPSSLVESKISSAPVLVTSRRQDSEVNLSPRSRRLHRLLAIHEKSQSMDAIFI